MRLWTVPVRITRTRRCAEGFYLLVNGTRIHFKSRAAAIEGADALLQMQRIQVVSVREFAARRKCNGKERP